MLRRCVSTTHSQPCIVSAVSRDSDLTADWSLSPAVSARPRPRRCCGRCCQRRSHARGRCLLQQPLGLAADVGAHAVGRRVLRRRNRHEPRRRDRPARAPRPTACRGDHRCGKGAYRLPWFASRRLPTRRRPSCKDCSPTVLRFCRPIRRCCRACARPRRDARIVTFGTAPEADVRLLHLSMDAEGSEVTAAFAGMSGCASACTRRAAHGDERACRARCRRDARRHDRTRTPSCTRSKILRQWQVAACAGESMFLAAPRCCWTRATTATLHRCVPRSLCCACSRRGAASLFSATCWSSVTLAR